MSAKGLLLNVPAQSPYQQVACQRFGTSRRKVSRHSDRTASGFSVWIRGNFHFNICAYGLVCLIHSRLNSRNFETRHARLATEVEPIISVAAQHLRRRPSYWATLCHRRQNAFDNVSIQRPGLVSGGAHKRPAKEIRR